MTSTIEPVPDRIDQQQLAQQLVEAARTDGVELVGPGGLLTGLTKSVLETALEAEMSEHLGYDRHDPAGVYFGTSTGQLFASADEGESWSELATYLPPIRSVEVAVVD